MLLIFPPTDWMKIVDAINKQLKAGRYKPDYIYGKGNAGEIIAKKLIYFEVQVQKEFIPCG